jgi:hypothetical protein
LRHRRTRPVNSFWPSSRVWRPRVAMRTAMRGA